MKNIEKKKSSQIYGDASRHVLQIKFNKGKVGSVMQY